MLSTVGVRRLLAATAVTAALTACGSTAATSSSTASSAAGSTATSAGGGSTTTTKAAATTGTTAKATTSSAAGRPPMGGSSSGPTPTKADVAYASTSSSQVLDLWLPPNASGPVPLVIFIHGGAFKGGDKAMEAGNVQALLDRGYAVASVNYRLSGEAPFPAAVQDVKAAVRYLRANATTYGINPDQIVAWGESAGGNLAAMLGVTGGQASSQLDDPSLGNAGVSSAVQAVVDWFGPTDFLSMDSQQSSTKCTSPESHDPASSPESQYVGAAIQTVPDQAKAASPLTYVATASTLPVFVIAHGDTDCQIPPAQSQSLHDALVTKGATATLTILPGAGHGDPQFSTQVTPTIDILDQTFGR
ncbi:MAG: alpha/beta hydrolase [Acidimicrobiales bacterium]